MSHTLVPKLVTVFREGYTRKDLVADVTAGLIVGILALPMSIAFAIASGARPEQGLYTAILAGFLGGLTSGSRYQISGPTGAFIVLIADTHARYGYDGLVVATIIAGFLLLAMGFCRFGAAIKFIPYPVTIGFTSGIALLIFTTQVRDFAGIHLEGPLPGGFLEKWIVYFQNIDQISPVTLAFSLGSVAVVLLWPRVSSVIPGSLVAIVVSTAVVQVFELPVETIGDLYGTVPNTFPMPSIPKVSWDQILQLLNPAIAIALLAGIESLLSAVVADGMTGRRHRSDMELISQGLANIGSAFCGGIPTTGAIARTATNIKSGGQTPVASLVHAATLMVALLFLGKAVAMIPMATLSAILMIVAYRMSEWHHFLGLFRSPKGDVVILLVTFFLTVLVDLVTAIEAGIILAAFVFINRIAEATHTDDLRIALEEEDDPVDHDLLLQLNIPDEVEVYQLYGSLFFAAAEKFKMALARLDRTPKVLILRMRHVLNVDATGIRALEDIYDSATRDKTVLVLSGLKPALRKTLAHAGFLDRVGADNIKKDIKTAVARASEIVHSKDE